jgi:2-methylisocitrate lyase-like PEP mutase family enzyme
MNSPDRPPAHSAPGLRDKAELLRSLHVPGRPLLLANAWDVASAAVGVAAGAPAIATTSAGLAWSLGAADGDRIDRDVALAAVARIAAAVDVPVTADVERGFGADAAGVADTVRGVLSAGAVGVNLEDSVAGGLRPVAEAAERVAAARAAADEAGVPLYLNARTDVFLRGIGAPDERVDLTLERAAAYLDAGASGIFVPGLADLTTIATLTKGIAAPVNVLAGFGSPPVAELAAAGVARVSLGANVAAAAYRLAARATEELLTGGTYDEVRETYAWPGIQGLFMRDQDRS